MPKSTVNTRKIALCGIFLGLAVMLTSVESAVFGSLPGGIRIGLANIAVMLAVRFIDVPSAFAVTVLKSVFVLVTRGVTAGTLSLSGGIPAFLLSAVLLKRTRASYLIISVLSAVVHIVGQVAALCFIADSTAVFGCLPFSGTAAVISGTVTGIVLRTVMPAAEKAVEKYGIK